MAEIKVGETRNVLDPNSMTFEERKIELEQIQQQEKEERKRQQGSQNTLRALSTTERARRGD